MNIDDIINLTDEQLKQIFAYIDKHLGIHKTNKTRAEIVQHALNTEEGRTALSQAMVGPVLKTKAYLEYHAISNNRRYILDDEKQ